MHIIGIHAKYAAGECAVHVEVEYMCIGSTGTCTCMCTCNVFHCRPAVEGLMATIMCLKD